MRRVLIVILSILVSGLASSAQSLKVLHFESDEQDLEAKLNPVLSQYGETAALIRVKTSDEITRFQGDIIRTPICEDGEWILYVRPGSRYLKIKAKGDITNKYVFPEAIFSSFVYNMKVGLVNPQSFETVLIPAICISSSQMSYGLMAGLMKKFGGYVKATSDFNRVPATEIECNNKGYLPDGTLGWFSGESQKSRLSVTAGALAQVWGPVCIYIGVGYGQRTLAWEEYDHSFAKVTPASAEGLETECGIMLKRKGLAITSGINETDFRRLEFDFGFGIYF